MSTWDDASRIRSAIMREGLDLARLDGLEIGPLSHPIVRRSDGNILYVDQTDSASLRRTYAGSPHVNADDIVEIDALWGNRTLAECLDGRLVDYIMASHVAEHVPDLVTWLAEARSVLKPGGQLRLVMPDMRFSHDALRQETTLTDLLTAWILRARRPQVRDILDFRRLTSAAVDGGGIYNGTADLSGARPDHTPQVAIASARAALEQPDVYFDVHCQVFRACGFARLMRSLVELDLLPFACATMIDTAPPLFEFYVFMTASDYPAAAQRSWQDVQATLHDPLPGSAAARRTAETKPPPELADPGLAHALATARRETAETRARLAEAERQLAAMRHSLSWRLTAPLRRVRARL